MNTPFFASYDSLEIVDNDIKCIENWTGNCKILVHMYALAPSRMNEVVYVGSARPQTLAIN